MMIRKKAVLAVLTAILVTLPLSGETKDLNFAGSLSFTFGDLDVSAIPGPEFWTDETGSVGNINLSLRNRRLQAGVALSLAQAAENVTSIGTLEEVPFPLEGAYIRAADVLNLFEVKLYFRGDQNSIGTMAVTDTHPDPIENLLDYHKGDGILTVKLSPGILGDFNLGITTNQVAGRSAKPTINAIPHIWGVSGLADYEGEKAYTNLTCGFMNHRYPAETFLATVNGGLLLGNEVEFSVDLESTLIGITGTTLALGGALKTGISLYGFTLTATGFAKNSHFGKDEDLLTIYSALDDFNTRTGENSLGWDLSCSFMPYILIGSNLLTLSGGVSQIVTGHSRCGWNAGALLNFYTFDELPLTGGFSIGQYGDDTMGVFGNADLLWNVYISYNYYGLELKFDVGQKVYEDPMDPSGGIRNSALGYTLTGTVYF